MKKRGGNVSVTLLILGFDCYGFWESKLIVLVLYNGNSLLMVLVIWKWFWAQNQVLYGFWVFKAHLPYSAICSILIQTIPEVRVNE